MLRNERNFPFNVELIPYGWGHSEGDVGGGGDDLKEAIVFEETAELARSRGGAGASRERAAVSPDSSVVHVVRPASASDKGEDGGGGGEKGDAMPMNAMSAALAAAAEKGRRPSNYSEIFDESLR